MQLFLTRLASFISILLLILICFFLLNSFLFKEVNKADYSNIETLILGDSHSRFLNEEIIPKSQNLSYSAETYKVAYYKLKYISELNNLENLVLSFSYNNFSYLHESRMLNEYRTIYRLYPIENLATLIKTTNSLKSAIEVLASNVFTFNRDYFFKYFFDFSLDSPLDENIHYKTVGKAKLSNANSKFYNYILDNKTEAIEKKVNRRINHHYNYKESGNYGSNIAVDYFIQIIDLCEEKNINLLLVTLPIHPTYRDKIPDFFVEKFTKIKKQAITKEHVTYVNLEKYFDGKDELMLDQDHQSEYGGALISKHLVNKYLH